MTPLAVLYTEFYMSLVSFVLITAWYIVPALRKRRRPDGQPAARSQRRDGLEAGYGARRSNTITSAAL